MTWWEIALACCGSFAAGVLSTLAVWIYVVRQIARESRRAVLGA